MAKVKRADICWYDSISGNPFSFQVDIQVDTYGQFYCLPPEDIAAMLASNYDLRKSLKLFLASDRKKDGTIMANTMDHLIRGLEKTLELVRTPERTEELVIRYVLESHISFAEQLDGTIVPNAGWPNAVWQNREMYGGHHATKPSRGYSMVVGAKAYTKTTHRYANGHEEATYECYHGIDPYGKPVSHFDQSHPAAVLNAWCSYHLPNDAKEMPYTDTAAVWFYELILSMAHMQRKIQEMISDQDQFISMINEGTAITFNRGESV